MLFDKKGVAGVNGKLVAEYVGEPREDIPEPRLASAEQSNSSILYEKELYLKLFRRVEEGENPDIEIGRFLAARESAVTAGYLGSLSYKVGGKVLSLAILQKQVPNESDGWQLLVGQVGQIAERILTENLSEQCQTPPILNLADVRNITVPEEYQNVAGYTLRLAQQLGIKTAEMHITMGTEDRDPNFIPEAYTPFHQRSVFQSFRNLTDRVFNQLRSHVKEIPEESRALGEEVLAREKEIYDRFAYMKTVAIDALRVRIHGDYHLGQVLFTGEDFLIIDFEGEPARGIGERKLKRSPLKDVAGMLRSFDYAAEFYLKKHVLREQDKQSIENCLRIWADWSSIEFVKAYLTRIEGHELLPKEPEQLDALLKMFLLEKALYEVGYELRSRPEWVEIPLRGVLKVLKGAR